MSEQTMGKLICKLRKEKGMTQKELASILNITDKAVSKWERDIARPDVSIYPKLAEVLGVTTEELISVKLNENKYEVNIQQEDSLYDERKIEFEEAVMPEFTSEYKQYIPHIIFQLIGIAFGIVFAVVESKSFFEMLYRLLGASTMIAGLMRLAVCTFKFARIKLGRELVNPITLETYIAPRNGLGVVLAFVSTIAALWLFGAIESLFSEKYDILGIIPLFIFNVLALGSFILDIKTVAKKSTRKESRKSVRVSLIVVAAYLLLYLASATAFYFYDKGHNTDELEQKLEVNAETIKEAPNVLDVLLEKAYIYSEEREQKELEQGFEIMSSSKIHSAYFLSRVEDEDVSYTRTNDTVIVISSYHVGTPGIFGFDREEWYVWAFPYFDIDDSGNLYYREEVEYYDVIFAENFGEVYEWLKTEYSGMEITQIYGDTGLELQQ